MDTKNVRLHIRELRRSAELDEYLLSQIDESTVAQRLRERLDPRLGKFYAILPEGLDPGDVKHWAWARLGLGYPLNPHAVLDDVVRRFLCEPNRKVLGQDNHMPETELEPPDFENLIVHDDEHYWEVAGPVTESFSFTSLPLGSYPTILYFYSSASAKQKILDDRAIDEILDGLIGLAVGALDEDTYLIWWRTDRTPFPASSLAPTF